jgi:23S rRNA (guanine745-N1)-methyltransferase
VLFVCPLDRSPLEPVGGVVRCGLGHTFDRAREGYLNLLVGGRKRSRPAGDPAPMVRARRAFFDAGHYAEVADAVAAQVLATGGETVLDAGCGEGRYLGRVGALAADRSCWGIDVAKTAVKLAARRYPGAGFAVASSYALPVADATVDVVMTVFSPRPFAEFGRVLRPGGVVVAASPGPEHLAGLTDLVYGRHRPHGQRPHTADDPDLPLAPVRRERVYRELHLTDRAAIVHLLQMTPYYWHASPQRQAAITGLDRLDTVVDVVVTTHRVGPG